MTLTACNATGCETLTQSAFIETDLSGDYCNALIFPHQSDLYSASCTGFIYDNGLPTGEYASNTDAWIYLQPAGAESVTLTVNNFRTDQYGDTLYIHDGPNADAPIIAAYTGYDPGDGTQITSSGDAVSLHFRSNQSSTYFGFEIEYACNNGIAPVANFTQQTSGDCVNQVAFANATTGGANYAWDFGDGTTSLEESPTHSYSAPGDYTVVLTAYNELGNTSVSQTVSITDLPFTLEIDSPGGVQVNVPEAFTYNASLPLTNVKWNSGIGFLSEDETAIFTYSEEGEVTLTLTGTDANGCEVTARRTFTVGTTDTDDVSILTAFDLYPNPTDGALTVSIVLPAAADTELTVYNTLGQILLSEKRESTTSYRHRLDISKLPSGQYFVVLAVDGEILGREAVMRK